MKKLVVKNVVVLGLLGVICGLTALCLHQHNEIKSVRNENLMIEETLNYMESKIEDYDELLDDIEHYGSRSKNSGGCYRKRSNIEYTVFTYFTEDEELGNYVLVDVIRR